ncbi:MAG: aminotransferase class I/II-fold pyridoxal phosphate-dependent enzyme [Candidatus Electrothrix sp. MAN1_4]|nr:aminotransferase class I/II-fold pyridoxal phosphate-dependent enzyme [Candidatus Electrothrix sp. MAN1_4]
MNKQNTSDLGYFGGLPLFEKILHVGKPNVGSRDKFFSRMEEMFDRGWLTNNGPFVREFEQRIEELTGAKHCIAMCNGTVALEIAVRSLGLKGEVIVPSFTFAATAHCLQWQEITPVFCDIDPSTHTIDPAKIENLITPRTTGIIGVHLWGRPCNVVALQEIANNHDLRLMFDASHALGASNNGLMVGNFGSLEVFSFHATKFVNCFEGGAIVTNDDSLAKKIRLMKNFGFDGLDNVVYLGTNGKMSEPSAAMGLTSLDALDDIVGANKRNYRTYKKGLQDVSGVDMLDYDEKEDNNYQYIVLEIDEPQFGLSRDTLVVFLHAENVRARRYFYPGCHRMEPYRSFFPNAGLLLPKTKILTEKVICLPTGKSIKASDIETICELIKFFSEHSNQISERLK